VREWRRWIRTRLRELKKKKKLCWSSGHPALRRWNVPIGAQLVWCEYMT